MKTVLITGAGRGIGFALTKEFTSSGYQVIGTYRSESSAKDLFEFAKKNPSVTLALADVRDEKSFSVLKDILRDKKTIDILINNSGVIGDRAKSLLEMDLATVESVFQVNTLGPMRVTRLALPYMNPAGTVAQISSLMGSISDSSGGYYDYRMSKAALNMFNQCLSKEFPRLTCLTLHPGWVQTEMGGAGATLPVEQSARGLYKVITTSTEKQSGQFFDYSGKRLPW